MKQVLLSTLLMIALYFSVAAQAVDQLSTFAREAKRRMLFTS